MASSEPQLAAGCGRGCARRANSIEGGTSEINLNIVAKRVLWLARREE